MFYENKLKTSKSVKYTTIEYDFDKNFICDGDVYNAKGKDPILNINFSTNNNSLTNSYGESEFFCSNSQNGNAVVYPNIGELYLLKDLKYFVNTETDNGLDYTKKKMIVQTSNNMLYYANLNDGSTTTHELIQLDEGCVSKMFTYYYNLQNYLLISTKLNEDVKYYVINSNFQIEKYNDAPHIFDICSHNNMLFIVNEDGLRNKLYYINDSNPYNLMSNKDDLNAIGLPVNKGKIMKIISYDDYLYVICEYGIVRIVSYKTQDELYIEDVYSGTARIIENSIVQGGENIFFADINNIYTLDGNSVEKIEYNFKSLYQDVVKWKSCACYDDGKYYLSTRINYFDGIAENYVEEKNNSLIVYDVESKKIEVCCDISIKKLEVYYDETQSRVAILSGENTAYQIKTLSKSGLYNGDVIAKKVYQSHYENFGDPSALKVIKNISLNTNEDIVLKLDCDGSIIEFAIGGNESDQTIIINKRAKNFSVIIESKTTNPIIKNLKVVVGKYE